MKSKKLLIFLSIFCFLIYARGVKAEPIDGFEVDTGFINVYHGCLGATDGEQCGTEANTYDAVICNYYDIVLTGEEDKKTSINFKVHLFKNTKNDKDFHVLYSYSDGAVWTLIQDETTVGGLITLFDEHEISALKASALSSSYILQSIKEYNKNKFNNAICTNIDLIAEYDGGSAELKYSAGSSSSNPNKGEAVDEFTGESTIEKICSYSYTYNCGKSLNLKVKMDTTKLLFWEVEYEGRSNSQAIDKTKNAMINIDAHEFHINSSTLKAFYKEDGKFECISDEELGYVVYDSNTDESNIIQFEHGNSELIVQDYCPSQEENNNQHFGGNPYIPEDLPACQDKGVLKALKIVRMLITIIQILVPIIIIITGVISLTRAILVADESKIKPAVNTLIVKVIVGMIVAFVPNIILALVETINGYQDIATENRYKNCITCIKSLEECEAVISKMDTSSK